MFASFWLLCVVGICLVACFFFMLLVPSVLSFLVFLLCDCILLRLTVGPPSFTNKSNGSLIKWKNGKTS